MLVMSHNMLLKVTVPCDTPLPCWGNW